MRNALRQLFTYRTGLGLFCGVIVLLLCALLDISPSTKPDPPPSMVFGNYLGPGFFSPPPGVRPVNQVVNSRIPHARRSYAWRYHGKNRELVTFSTPIQHVVVIYMENRTPEDLFGGIFNWTNPVTMNKFGTDLDLVDPSSINLSPWPMTSPGDPDHSHWAFVKEVEAVYSPDAYRYVLTPPSAPGAPSPPTSNYITLIERWGYNNSTLQSNEGPSFVAHQYGIAGQSGGLSNSNIAPNGITDNPHQPVATSQPGAGSCAAPTPPNAQASAVDMYSPYPTPAPTPTASPVLACNEYNTIFDAIETAQPHPVPSSSAYYLWQYIAKDDTSIWSAPMSILHLYDAYSANPTAPWQPFAVDADAENFALNVARSTHPTPSPERPFAEFTFITPCLGESDHPNTAGPGNSSFDDGPDWLAYIINTIGESDYWDNTAIIVTWDDWGGWYDNFTAPPPGAPWPYHPSGNPYANPSDPNEWGFRVPLIIISPWVNSQGEIYSTFISQGAILNFVETTLDLPTNAMGGDDLANGSNDLTNMLCLTTSCTPFAYGTPLPSNFTPTSDDTCPTGPGGQTKSSPTPEKVTMHGRQRLNK